MRTIAHPGPLSPDRWRSIPATGRWERLTLRTGLTVNEAVARAFAEAGFAGGYARLGGLFLAPLRYVIPAASDGRHAAWYSETFAPEGIGRIEQAGAVVGIRDGASFLHCHGSWRHADGSRRMGHLLPHDSVLERDCIIDVLGIAGATFEAEEDPETAFKLFAPRARTSEGAAGARAILCTVRPNEDVSLVIEAVCREYGIGHAQVHGIGSLVGADFEDASHFPSYATEVLIREGSVRPGPDGPLCRLDIVLVGMDGSTACSCASKTRSASPSNC
jgi:predicted DNA-binding protein with PD1-like motif